MDFLARIKNAGDFDWANAHEKAILGTFGEYHLWENGFCRGSASKDAILKDAKTLNICIDNRNIDSICDDICRELDKRFIEVIEKGE